MSTQTTIYDIIGRTHLPEVHPNHLGLIEATKLIYNLMED